VKYEKKPGLGEVKALVGGEKLERKTLNETNPEVKSKADFLDWGMIH